MLSNRAFVKKTKRGNIAKVVREHYLRDDIWSGTALDPDCDPSAVKLSSDARHYLVIDTNIALHQIDFLEHPAIDDVIVPSIVLDEIRHKNKSVYDRLRALTSDNARRFFVFANEHHKETFIKANPSESPNDRNDRAIRVAAKWYKDKLEGKMEILLVTNDRENRRKAKEETGLAAYSMKAYAKLRTDAKELVDLVAVCCDSEEEEEMDVDGGSRKAKKRRRVYEDHRPMSELTEGLKNGSLHQGVLRCSRHSWLCGFVESESAGQTIKILGLTNMNRAMAGDVVVVEPTESDNIKDSDMKEAEPESDEESAEREGGVESVLEVPDAAPVGESGAVVKCPLGRVVGIIKRNWRTRGYCGSIEKPKFKMNSGRNIRVAFRPKDRSLPPIWIRTGQCEQLLGKRVICVIDAWERDSRWPMGRYVRMIGDMGTRDTETEVLLLENDINTNPFTPAVHACLPPMPWAVGAKELQDEHRMDLRDRCVCSVDPPGCTDIDDALHIKDLPNGNIEVGVHIADVTYFVKPETPLDFEACVRGTSVYLVQKRIDMLPKALTEDICSLRSNVDRVAFTVMWEVTPEGNIVHDNTVFTKSLIRSRAALTYAEAQSRIDDERLTDELSCNLRKIMKFTKLLRSRRVENGALELASAEVKFQLDTETHDPLDVGMYQTRDTNRMVEEMMLLANSTVAEKILHGFPACACLRRHPGPEPKKFESLLVALEASGISLDLASNRTLADSLDRAVLDVDPFFNTLVRMMTTRCLTEAQYFGSAEYSRPEYGHYGLAMELYTHFTSPIRRYADVVVHRLLAASIQLDPLPPSLKDRENMQKVTTNLNLRNRNARFAGRDSASLFTLLYFRNKTTIEEGRVMGLVGIKKRGIIVFIPKFGIEGPVFRVKGSDDTWDFVPEAGGVGIVSRDGARRFRVFDKVKVQIEVKAVDAIEDEVVLSVVEGEEACGEMEMSMEVE
ncbi:hypothetical protein BSKO_09417 [Bryopsis sp. KO-2023]|nr:hypothetical protein BSKO_09417 [Bryopsis sp. KO-2023]